MIAPLWLENLAVLSGSDYRGYMNSMGFDKDPADTRVVVAMSGGVDSSVVAAMLHDVGKVKIPDEILNKEGALNQKEYEVMKTHTTAGRSLLMSKSDVPPVAVDVAYCHHEFMSL